PIRTSHAELRWTSAHFRSNEACAHHWWCAYLAAEDPIQAYAAWILFLRSADRRAWTWMREDILAKNNKDSFMELKLKHVQLNRSTLTRAMEKRQDKLDDRFLDSTIVNDIGPWRKEAREE